MDHRLGMHDDLDPVVRAPNRWCASITSRPLFIRVAESIVILRAHLPGRMRSASSAVTLAVGAAGRGTGRRTRSGRAARRSGGRPPSAGTAPSARSRPAAARRRSPGQRRHQLAAGHQALLVGERDATPRSARRSWAQAGGADDAVQDQVGAAAAISAGSLLPGEHPPAPGPRARSAASGSARATPARRARAPARPALQLPPAASPTTGSSAERPITSSACSRSTPSSRESRPSSSRSKNRERARTASSPPPCGR